MPEPLYNWRFDAFQRDLRRLTVYYQPVVRLAQTPAQVTIASWEALARDPETGAVPGSVLAGAELWGQRFMIETDIHLNTVAIEGFMQQDGQYGQQSAELSVNVYPASIHSDAYYVQLRDVLRNSKIARGRVILELSEKQPLGTQGRPVSERRRAELFVNRLGEMSAELGVAVAIDDFGVGYATLDRLSSLELSHVKLDRAILFHRRAIDEIQLVHEITARIGMTNGKVIAEGFDDECPLTLRELSHQGNLTYVQGFWFAEPQPTLFSLEAEVRERTARLLDN